jgi:hypothetical protein
MAETVSRTFADALAAKPLQQTSASKHEDEAHLNEKAYLKSSAQVMVSKTLVVVESEKGLTVFMCNNATLQE